MKTDGSVIIDTKIDTKGFKSGTNDIVASLDKMGAKLKKIGGLIASVFAVQKLIQFGKECIDLGSDLSEVQNVVDNVFTTMSGDVDNFARSAAQNFGLSETMAKQFTGTFGAMAKSFGFTEQEAYSMSTALTGLAGDVASFYNMTQDEAYTKLKSVFTGETESLKELGVVMTQSALDQYAMANGWGKTTSAMTEQEKVALRYQFVMQQLNTANGDFLRTSDGWANQVRVLGLQINSLKATIGQGLINLFTPVIKVINIVIGKLATVAEAFKRFTELITGKKGSESSGVSAAMTDDLGGTADAYTDAATGAQNYTKATKDAANATKEADKANKGYLSGLDQMAKYQTTAASSASPASSGGSAGKTPSASGGVPAFDFGTLPTGQDAVSKAFDEIDKKIQNFLKLVKPTTDAFKKLWNEGFGRLKDFTWTALKDFYTNFLVPIGKWTFGEGIPRLVNALNDGLMRVDFGRINSGLARLWTALSSFTITIGNGLVWVFEHAIVPLGTWVANEVVPRFLTTLSTAIEVVNTIITAAKPGFEWFWNNVLTPIAAWTGGIFLKVWDAINSALRMFGDWCKRHPGIIATITKVIIAFFAAFAVAKAVSGIISLISSLSSLISILKKVGSVITLLFSNPVIAAVLAVIAVVALLVANWDKVSGFAKTVWGGIKKTVCGAVKSIGDTVSPIFNKMGATIKQQWDRTKSLASTTFGAVKNTVMNTWEAIKSGTSTVWNLITGNVSKAWNVIKTGASDAFTAIGGILGNAAKALGQGAQHIGGAIYNGLKMALTGLVNVVKAPFNGVISLLNAGIRGVIGLVNAMISALNFLHIDIPSGIPGIGGKRIGFNIPKLTAPQIPLLAKGAVIPPNAPFMAMLGDQKRGNNIETPENLLRQIVREEAGNSKSSSYRFTANINRRVLFDEMIEEAKMRRNAIGTNPFALS